MHTEKNEGESMAKPIMVQGTMSNAGKSLIAAGLCRIFHQDGYKTAPFKSQNMALNSCITSEGLEMGRAQVMQAEAAGISASVLMNPILLKPSSDVGSQVILNGEVFGYYSARDYFALRKKLVPDILRAYRTLDSQYHILVIEGAGSPAEINLKDDDIVNMGMARMAGAPVLLVGDIDRGGVFAQLYGTVALLSQSERSMVRGFVINKFRGDKSLLDPGIRMLEEMTGIPVVGVVPYMDIDVDDEDSLSDRLDIKHRMNTGAADIAVIRFPHISNFTDMNTLSRVGKGALRYVDRPSELGTAAMVILPGTRNTIGDLLWMRQTGLEAQILKLHSRGASVMGICGGYQMLGEELSDPEGEENGDGKSTVQRGMGLLPVRTVFGAAKTRSRVKGCFTHVDGTLKGLSGLPFEGYEIHMGKTFASGENARPLTELTASSGQDSARREDGTVCGEVLGTYVHGILDSPEAASAIVRGLEEKMGINPKISCVTDLEAFKASQYDKLAETLRRYMDIDRIYEILEKGL